MTTYSPDREWQFSYRPNGHTRTVPLELHWELENDPITDDYMLHEITAAELWDQWIKNYINLRDDARRHPHTVRILWSVHGPGTAEAAPFQTWDSRLYPGGNDDFLTYYTWPVDPKTGERLQWTRLPVVDKLWRPGRADKGGFVQEHTGWKPSPLQPTVNIDHIAQAAGTTRPDPIE